MSNDTMDYVWRDYNPKTMGYIENWLDESAIKLTGLDEGFCDFYEYCSSFFPLARKKGSEKRNFIECPEYFEACEPRFRALP